MKALLFTLALMVGNSALADSCRDIDVRDRMSPEMQEVFRTPYMQAIGWCYAYAAADLLSARLDQQVSPFHIGLSYSNSISGLSAVGRNIFGLKRGGGLFDAGYPHEAFKQMKKKGYACSESVVTSSDRAGSTAMNMQYAEDLIKNKPSGSMGLDYEETRVEMFFEKRFPQIDAQLALAYLKSGKIKSAPIAVQYIAESACQDQRIAIPQNLRMETKVKKTSDEKMAPFIDKALNKYRPVSFRYNMKNLANLDGGVLFTNFAQHVSTIIGRKRVGNQCVYVVRNSWGQGCHYKEGIFCNHEEGTFQIPVKELERSIYAADYISN